MFHPLSCPSLQPIKYEYNLHAAPFQSSRLGRHFFCSTTSSSMASPLAHAARTTPSLPWWGQQLNPLSAAREKKEISPSPPSSALSMYTTHGPWHNYCYLLIYLNHSTLTAGNLSVTILSLALPGSFIHRLG
ncbi:hypothetical protein CABS01_07712 [Colletotrichum abscissum]|uniref:uncharacterized protein n=1 Tax=Colletotrichum abscissum TaxID=1671311 RepID=UPI0027D70EF0|nr:uncharacterized protein CABS01_07712 [Colletotrichum abscissum]KAK1510040.1 hypothetical protein CABS01_07712 [Colletotrichum abscissum]